MRVQLLKDKKSGEAKTWPKGIKMDVDHISAAKWIKDGDAIDITPADPAVFQSMIKKMKKVNKSNK